MQSIADAMNRAGAATKHGGKWHAVTIQKVLRIHALLEAAKLPDWAAFERAAEAQGEPQSFRFAV